MRKSTMTSKLLPTPRTNNNSPRLNGSKSKITPSLQDRLYSPEDSHASPSPKPEEGRERQMTAISGRRCYELYENLLPYGSLVKMLAASLLGTTAWYSDK